MSTVLTTGETVHVVSVDTQSGIFIPSHRTYLNGSHTLSDEQIKCKRTMDMDQSFCCPHFSPSIVTVRTQASYFIALTKLSCVGSNLQTMSLTLLFFSTFLFFSQTLFCLILHAVPCASYFAVLYKLFFSLTIILVPSCKQWTMASDFVVLFKLFCSLTIILVPSCRQWTLAATFCHPMS